MGHIDGARSIPALDVSIVVGLNGGFRERCFSLNRQEDEIKKLILSEAPGAMILGLHISRDKNF
jgi:hypothetical protein